MYLPQSDKEYQALKKAYHQVFNDPWQEDYMFNEHITKKAILCHDEFTCILPKPYWEVLAQLEKKRGARFIYLSITESLKEEETDWLIPLDFGEKYLQNNEYGYVSVMTNILYSSFGDWGIVIEDGEFTVIGGPTDFVDDVFRLLSTTIEEHALRLIQSYLKSSKGKIAPSFEQVLIHIYGENYTNLLLSRFRS